MILLVGATGNIGRPLLEELLSKNADVRVLVHSEQQAASLQQRGAQVAIGDMSKPETLPAALTGVDHVFVLSPAVAEKVEWETALVNAAREAGAAHIVKISALGASRESVADFMRQHAEVEDQIRASGLAYTFLRPNLFMQNLVPFYGQSIALSGNFYASADDARIGWVDVRDIAAVAARALTEQGHEGQVYDITGPELLSHGEVADKLSTLLGKPVQYVAVPDEAAYGSMVGMGMPEWNARAVVTLNQFYKAGGGEVVTDTVERMIGQPPRRMDAFLAENHSAFGA